MCSTADVTTWRPGPRDTRPLTARLLAAVATEVKTTPVGVAPTRRASLARAPSSEARASSPSEWGADGLPTPPSKKGRMTAATRVYLDYAAFSPVDPRVVAENAA